MLNVNVNGHRADHRWRYGHPGAPSSARVSSVTPRCAWSKGSRRDGEVDIQNLAFGNGNH